MSGTTATFYNLKISCARAGSQRRERWWAASRRRRGRHNIAQADLVGHGSRYFVLERRQRLPPHDTGAAAVVAAADYRGGRGRRSQTKRCCHTSPLPLSPSSQNQTGRGPAQRCCGDPRSQGVGPWSRLRTPRPRRGPPVQRSPSGTSPRRRRAQPGCCAQRQEQCAAVRALAASSGVAGTGGNDGGDSTRSRCVEM